MSESLLTMLTGNPSNAWHTSLAGQPYPSNEITTSRGAGREGGCMEISGELNELAGAWVFRLAGG